MPDIPQLPDNPFWDFSLAVYGREGVATACLALQDRHGLDVNLLLCCAWAGSRGQGLQRQALARLVDVTRPWQQEVVAPLRALRRDLTARTDAGTGLIEPLRDRILTAELQAEAGEQQLLFDALSAEALPPPAAPDSDAAARNLLAYLELCGVSASTDDTADLTTLLAVALPDMMPLEAVWLLTARA